MEANYHIRNPLNGRFESSHGMKRTKIYRIWCGMKERCNNPNNKCYKYYGLKGVTVCDKWSKSFQDFYTWAINNGYKEGLSIDRIDSEKGYSPENCRWATSSQQNRNYSRNRFLTYNGETLCLKDMADKYGINRATLLFRLRSGLSIEDALSKTDRRTVRYKEK